MFPDQLEFAGDVIQALPMSGFDCPIYAEWKGHDFVIVRAARVEREGEDVVVLELREVSR